MLLWPECIPCTLKMALDVARTVLEDEGEVRDFLREVTEIDALRAMEWQITSPEVSGAVWRTLVERAGDPDPLRAVKDRQNRAALELYPLALGIVQESEDPFLDALKLAIAGNALDAMVGVREAPAAAMIDGLKKLVIDSVAVDEFRRRIRSGTEVVYFSDNCGEIVFDKLFLETLRDVYGRRVTVVTRTLPVLNDATLEDAEAIQLGEVARVVENGIREPFPGTRLHKTSPEVRELVQAANLVVSKGVGNLDSLTEEESTKGRISFLYHGKCVPCCSTTGASPGDLIVFNS